MYLTKKHVSRRTVLRGMGATVALPFLEAMVPARTTLAKTAAAGRTRLSCIEMVHGAAGSTQFGLAKNLWSPAALGRGFDLLAEQPGAARSAARLHHHRQQHGLQECGGVRPEGDRRRSLPLERRVSDPGAPEADRRLRRLRRAVDGPVARAALWTGHADPVAAAVHRERGPVGRLRLRLRLRLYGHDQLGLAERAATDGPRSTCRLRRAVRRRRHPRTAVRESENRQQHPGLGRAGRTATTKDPVRPTACGWRAYLEDIREIERRIQKVEAHNTSGELRELPGRRSGFPTRTKNTSG